jgi:single-stranded DNA-binding protein
MKDLNRVQLIGHLGHDPAVTYTATGTARTTFSIATSARWKDTNGQVQEVIEWTRCVASVDHRLETCVETCRPTHCSTSGVINTEGLLWVDLSRTGRCS